MKILFIGVLTEEINNPNQTKDKVIRPDVNEAAKEVGKISNTGRH